MKVAWEVPKELHRERHTLAAEERRRAVADSHLGVDSLVAEELRSRAEVEAAGTDLEGLRTGLVVVHRIRLGERRSLAGEGSLAGAADCSLRMAAVLEEDTGLAEAAGTGLAEGSLHKKTCQMGDDQQKGNGTRELTARVRLLVALPRRTSGRLVV